MKISVFHIILLILCSNCQKESILTSEKLEIVKIFYLNDEFNTENDRNFRFLSNFNEIMIQNDVNFNQINTIQLKDFDLTLVSPYQSTFSFLKSIYIYIQTDELESVLVAKNENISNYPGKTITVYKTDEDIASFFTNKKQYLVIKTSTKYEAPISCKIEMSTILQVYSRD